LQKSEFLHHDDVIWQLSLHKSLLDCWEKMTSLLRQCIISKPSGKITSYAIIPTFWRM